MATRQYIGARYTPKFSGTYNNTQAYEALDVVDNGSGTTYIARKPVPPNIPLTNTEYWLVYGSSSGAILDLQTRMGTAENEITNINGSILTMGGQIGTINGSVLTMGGQIDTLNTEMSQAQSDINTLKVKNNARYILVSDSYGLVRNTQTPWTDAFKVLAGAADSDCYIWAEGSMGFNRTGDGGHTAQTLMESKASLVSHPETISDIIIAMGLNDEYGLTGLGGAITNCTNYAKTTYINAKIHIAFIGNQKSKNLTALEIYMAAITAYTENATGKNVNYLTGSENVMHNVTYFQADGVHPTTAGGLAIAKYILAAINGGSSFIVRKTCDITSSYLQSGSTMTQIIDNDTTKLSAFLNNTSSSFTLTRNSPFKIGSVDEPIVSGIGAVTKGIALIYGTDYLVGDWYLYAGDIYITSRQGGASVSVPSGAAIALIDMTIPTISI